MAAETLELSDSLAVEESLAMSGDNIKLGLVVAITIIENLDSVYIIVRTGDTAFIRSNVP